MNDQAAVEIGADAQLGAQVEPEFPLLGAGVAPLRGVIAIAVGVGAVVGHARGQARRPDEGEGGGAGVTGAGLDAGLADPVIGQGRWSGHGEVVLHGSAHDGADLDPSLGAFEIGIAGGGVARAFIAVEGVAESQFVDGGREADSVDAGSDLGILDDPIGAGGGRRFSQGAQGFVAETVRRDDIRSDLQFEFGLPVDADAEIFIEDDLETRSFFVAGTVSQGIAQRGEAGVVLFAACFRILAVGDDQFVGATGHGSVDAIGPLDDDLGTCHEVERADAGEHVLGDPVVVLGGYDLEHDHVEGIADHREGTDEGGGAENGVAHGQMLEDDFGFVVAEVEFARLVAAAEGPGIEGSISVRRVAYSLDVQVRRGSEVDLTGGLHPVPRE